MEHMLAARDEELRAEVEGITEQREVNDVREDEKEQGKRKGRKRNRQTKSAPGGYIYTCIHYMFT